MRDAAVDLVKAWCLIVVVALHAMMAGVTVGPDGLAITNALAGNPIFAWTTWVVQVMPLFFLLGGFSSLTQWRRMKADGATAGDYIRQRVHRLARPALLPIALVAATLATLVVVGLPNRVLSEVGFRIGQPLWFLAVYLGCSGLIPFMARLHDAKPRLTLATLLAAAIITDAVAGLLNAPIVGAFNLLFVWVFVQQLGFWYADGWFIRRRRIVLFGLAGAAFASLGLLTSVGGYSNDMYSNLNPPTVCILVLGVGQIMLFSWARPYLIWAAERAPIARLAITINRNSMTIYLWHVPVVVLIAVVMLWTSMAFPAPLSAGWWETRPLFLAAIGMLLIPVVLVVARFERRNQALLPCATGGAIAGVKVVLSVAGVATILILSAATVVNWVIGFALLFVAVQLSPLRVGRLRVGRLRAARRSARAA